MAHSSRHVLWIVLCCIVVVSSLSIGGQAAAPPNNTTNGTSASVINSTGDNQTGGQSSSTQGALRPSQNSSQENESGNNTSSTPGYSAGGGFRSTPSGPDPYSQEEVNSRLGNSSTNNSSGLGIHNDESKTNNQGGLGFNVGMDVFFSLVEGVLGGITDALKKFMALVWGAGTWTPHPGNTDNWFQNPQNGVWQTQWEMYKSVGQPLAFLLTIIATGMYFGLGSKSLHVLDPATERKGKRHLLVAWMMILLAWPLSGLYLGLVNLVAQFMIGGMTNPDIGAGALGTGLALIVILAVAVMEFWTVILMLLIFGLRLVGLVAFTPFLALLFALRAIPITSISRSADGIIQLWVYLVLLPLPVAALLSIGFSPGLGEMVTSLDAGGALMLVAIKVGALIGAIIVPFAMYQKMQNHGLATGVAGAGGAGGKLRDSYRRQRETATRRKQQAQNRKHNARNFRRGVRGKPQIRQNGQTLMKPDSRAYKAGRTIHDRLE